MDRVILSISAPAYSQIKAAKASVKNARATGISTEVLTLGVILAILQVLDGVLTAIGVAHLGTDIEGNAILRVLMEHVGYIPALVVIKSIALAVIVSICALSRKVQWLPLAMKAVIFIYVSAAVIPWTFVITKHIL